LGNTFAFIIPTFNAEKTIQQCLLSIVSQSYSDWRLIIRDDMSTDGTVMLIKNLTTGLGIHDRVSLTVNTEKHWEVRNIVEALKEIKPDEIVCRLDGDDWLCDLDALAILNHRYTTDGYDAIWTGHRWSFSNHNISAPMRKDADPYEHKWCASHFKTFRKALIEDVADENFRGEDGEYFQRIGDQALYLPALRNAKGNWHFEPIVAYHYTIDASPETFQTDDAKFQKGEAEFLRSRGYVETLNK